MSVSISTENNPLQSTSHDKPYYKQVTTNDYTLNFLWVNLNPQDRVADVAETIFGDGRNAFENAECIKDPELLRRREEEQERLSNQYQTDAERKHGWTPRFHIHEKDKSVQWILRKNWSAWEKLTSTFTYRISKWADANPGAHIDIWYDSALVTERARRQTFEMMQSLSESRGVDLQLKDIRHLPNLEGELECAMHPGTPIYYRVDALKVLIADYMMGSSEEKAKYCVVSDIDVEPTLPDQIFSKKTRRSLFKQGYVFLKQEFKSFENGFFIFHTQNKKLRDVHYQTMIKQAADGITFQRSPPSFYRLHRPGSQTIFKLYTTFREKIEESWKREKQAPRIEINCPRSQFGHGSYFPDSDPKAETFRFIGDSNIPYTRDGRAYDGKGTLKQLEELKDWEADPLPPLDGDSSSGYIPNDPLPPSGPSPFFGYIPIEFK